MSVFQNATTYAVKRKLLYKNAKKKCNPETLRQEVLIAKLLGEMGAGERILRALRENSEWDKDTLEAELHIFISQVNNEIAKITGSNRILEVEDVLRTYGYYEPKKEKVNDM